jgi:hypothetical protein
VVEVYIACSVFVWPVLLVQWQAHILLCLWCWVRTTCECQRELVKKNNLADSSIRWMCSDLSRFWAGYYILIYIHCWEMMKSGGSRGSLSLLFVMKVVVWHFVRDSHNVKTALVLMLPSNCCLSLQFHGYIGSCAPSTQAWACYSNVEAWVHLSKA